MKGHDALCPTSYPHLKDRKTCAYCNLIKDVRDEYKSRHTTQSKEKTYEAGYQDGMNFAISKLQEEVVASDA